MRTVDVEELGANLRDLLRAVHAGETLRVVDAGEVVAELVRPRAEQAPASDLEARLQALEAAGHVQRARIPDNRWLGSPQGAGLDPGTVQQILDDVRADRF